MDCVETLSFAIIINDALMEFFYLAGGLRQGCHIFPYLFILYADALSRGLLAVVQGTKLEPYWLTLGCMPLLDFHFIGDCLLISRAFVRNTMCFASVIETYNWTSG